MKTQNKNKLDFSKNSILELNEGDLKNIEGGTAWVCTAVISIITREMDHINITVVYH